MLDVYTDGSFDKDIMVGGWALAIVNDEGTIVQEKWGQVTDPNMNSMWSVGAEVTAAIMVAHIAHASGVAMTIHHDNEGVAKWVTGEFKTKNKATEKYATIMRPLYEKGLIKFKWVKGHSGNFYNDRVDKLSRMAIGKS